MEYILLVIFLFLLPTGYAVLRGAPWVPSKKNVIARLIEELDIKPGEKFCDLGCGDGRVVMALAEQGAEVYGYEISLPQYIPAKIRSWLHPQRKNIHIFYKSLWRADLSQMDVIYFFQIPHAYKALQKKLEREIKPEARVVAFMWPFKDWKPYAVSKEKGASPLYFYKKPFNV